MTDIKQYCQHINRDFTFAKRHCKFSSVFCLIGCLRYLILSYGRGELELGKRVRYDGPLLLAGLRT